MFSHFFDNLILVRLNPPYNWAFFLSPFPPIPLGYLTNFPHPVCKLKTEFLTNFFKSWGYGFIPTGSWRFYDQNQSFYSERNFRNSHFHFKLLTEVGQYVVYYKYISLPQPQYCSTSIILAHFGTILLSRLTLGLSYDPGSLWDHFTIPAHFGTILLSWLTLGLFYYPGSLWDHFTITANFGTILLSWLTLRLSYYPGSMWDHFTILAHFGTILLYRLYFPWWPLWFQSFISFLKNYIRDFGLGVVIKNTCVGARIKIEIVYSN